MDSSLYNKEIICPVCQKKFDVTKVRSKACKVSSRDSDFCVYYESTNPLLYDIWVCQNCGYAAQADKYEEIPFKDTKIILENITPRWSKRSLSGERNLDSAIDAFKLALLNLQVRRAKSSETAKICLRIAWLLRMKKDSKEIDFLKFALKGYKETYEKENFPVDKLDEFTCQYMIAELSRRVGELEESVKWFSRLISSPGARSNPKLIESAREQFQLVKEDLNKQTKGA